MSSDSATSLIRSGTIGSFAFTARSTSRSTCGDVFESSDRMRTNIRAALMPRMIEGP
jgi:hypothetical protein